MPFTEINDPRLSFNTRAKLSAMLRELFARPVGGGGGSSDASSLTSGTLDGNRLPLMSATKKGGVPATGTPSGKYLRDDGTWSSQDGTPLGIMEVDSNGDLMPRDTGTGVEVLELDSNGDLQPKV